MWGSRTPPCIILNVTNGVYVNKLKKKKQSAKTLSRPNTKKKVSKGNANLGNWSALHKYSTQKSLLQGALQLSFSHTLYISRGISTADPLPGSEGPWRRTRRASQGSWDSWPAPRTDPPRQSPGSASCSEHRGSKSTAVGSSLTTLKERLNSVRASMYEISLSRPVLRIHDILGWIRILLFSSLTLKMPAKKLIF